MPSASDSPAKSTTVEIKPVLLLTHDDVMWQRWREIANHKFLPARAKTVKELDNWRQSGRDLVVIDTDLPHLPTWADPAWANVSNGLTVLAASAHPSDDEAATALAAGCRGYLHSYIPVDTLSLALETLSVGGIWLGRTIMAKILRQVDARLPAAPLWWQGLTQREREVAERAARGESNQFIADSLGITERTVRAHLSAVFEKMGVQDRLMLALKVHGVN
jgi:DNA-binding NarL/FixJ family response regulator